MSIKIVGSIDPGSKEGESSASTSDWSSLTPEQKNRAFLALKSGSSNFKIVIPAEEALNARVDMSGRVVDRAGNRVFKGIADIFRRPIGDQILSGSPMPEGIELQSVEITSQRVGPDQRVKAILFFVETREGSKREEQRSFDVYDRELGEWLENVKLEPASDATPVVNPAGETVPVQASVAEIAPVEDQV
ncbi:hypothetical protein KBC89_02580 [Candidatus Woesebacteria bacterium]|nr:hypothetical protein [Candidatus Woesebacteria bacterium]